MPIKRSNPRRIKNEVMLDVSPCRRVVVTDDATAKDPWREKPGDNKRGYGHKQHNFLSPVHFLYLCLNL